ncbi:hypothetical protein [Burkholderia mayonis]|uniref:hypothetical protein n=1 Tax=Burkholderia mayonis TaxID=1385591 RepID=UPI000A47EA83|nr:hypothetical protein [Burkholderia mayonis]
MMFITPPTNGDLRILLAHAIDPKAREHSEQCWLSASTPSRTRSNLAAASLRQTSNQGETL